MEECARGAGTMLAIGVAEDEARALIARHDRTISISAFNGPRSLTLSGVRPALEAILAELEPQGVFARLVKVDHPFHHALMQPASDALETGARTDSEPPERNQLPFFSTVTGQRHSGEKCDRQTLESEQHPAARAVCAQRSQALAEFGADVWLELSAHPALVHSIQECLAANSGKAAVVSSVRREREHESLLETAMDLHRAGVSLDFAAMTPSRRLLPLPAYAWDRSRAGGTRRRTGANPVWRRAAVDCSKCACRRATPTWIARLDGRHVWPS